MLRCKQYAVIWFYMQCLLLVLLLCKHACNNGLGLQSVYLLPRTPEVSLE